MVCTNFRSDFHVGWKNQNKHSTLNSSFDDVSKWHEPDIKLEIPQQYLLFSFRELGTLPNVSCIGTGLQNLRECILWTQTKHDFEPKKKRPFWKQMSKNFIERYVYLIVFTTYVKAFSHRGMEIILVPMIFYDLLKSVIISF